MPNDPGLEDDTCTFIEAISGDGGVHSGGIWWLSPDIRLTGPTSALDKADPGLDNNIEVKLHRKAAGSSCQLPPGTESITAEVWVGNPSLAMTPDNPASTRMIGGIGTPLLAEGATANPVIVWNPPTGLDPSDPRSPGHKCLIARCYADPLTPSSTSFFVPDDPHVAQHNICIVPCGGPGAANVPGQCGFEVTTVNPDKDRAQLVTLLAVVDLKPSRFVQGVVLERVRQARGFKRLATVPPKRFGFDVRDFRDAEVLDDTRPGCLRTIFGGRGQHIYQAKVRLGAGQLTKLTFTADMPGAKLGDGYIFHLRQIGADQRDQGGLTLVMVIA